MKVVFEILLVIWGTSGLSLKSVNHTLPLGWFRNKSLDTRNCHPSIKNNSEIFIIGYGSLVYSISKRHTDNQASTSIPVKVSGFSRNFNVQGNGVTWLGVDRKPGSQFNGVAFKVPDENAIKRFDKREGLYCREEVAPDQLEFLVDESDFHAKELLDRKSQAQFWTYTVKKEHRHWPNSDSPIAQSYVDIFLSGCLEMETKYKITNYSMDCVKTTEGWEYSWVNDRVAPRISPQGFTVETRPVDNLLLQIIPQFYVRMMAD